MVNTTLLEVLIQPLGIFILALGAGFLIPLFYRANSRFTAAVFMLTLLAMTLIAGFNLLFLLNDASTIAITTAGVLPPFSINLQFGLFEGGFTTAVNCVAFLTAWHFLPTLKQQASSMLLYLILVMSINGIIMTRDLFNLFIFIEITSISTYSLIAMERTSKALSAGIKYIIATSIASAFFLMGTTFIYYQTGTLNIDDMINHSALIQGPTGFIATLFLLTSLLIELKPYPANGWGLDVYESTPGGIASLISVGVSAGIIFALYKLLPLMQPYLSTISVIAGFTFLFSNIIGLKQTNARRLLGYSSIGQIALLTLALTLLQQLGATKQLALIGGGLFINHLLAKAGMFWLADQVGQRNIKNWATMAKSPGLLILFALFISALVGLPPFPGFWAKWAFIMQLANHHAYGWILLILTGSLFEAAYLFRWFSYARSSEHPAETSLKVNFWNMLPLTIAVVLLFATGYGIALTMDVATAELFLPLITGSTLWLIDGLPGRLKAGIMLLAVAMGGYWLTRNLQGLNQIFSYLLIAGGLLVSMACMYRHDARRGFYPLLSILLLSLATLLSSKSSLEFFFSWELMTLSSYFMVTMGKNGVKPALQYLLFSLVSAYLILAGFALAFDMTGSLLLSELGTAGSSTTLIFSLLATGFLIKMGAFGVHIWMPDAYAEAEDDFTALLSAVVSKAAVFGLIIIAAHLSVHSETGLNAGYILGWIGILTATFGALMAVFQEDIKRMIAYSSMGQLGYIVAGIALMSHLGWVSALYMTVNHFLFKGILFLSIAAIVLRTQQRMMYKMGGLLKNMPVTFTFSMIAIIAMSGVPPLTGYGGKWMLFNALMDKGWYWIAALAFFSSAVAFLYMFRFLHTVFLGQRKLEHTALKESPVSLLLPQAIMIIAIMVFSYYPKLLLDPLSSAISPWIAGSLDWQGLSLQSHLGNWNATMIMSVIGGVWLVPLLILMIILHTVKVQKVKQFNIVYAAERPSRPEETHFAYNFFAHYRRAIGFLVMPRATGFYHSVVEWSHTIGSSLRIFYNGNGQTYALFILMYFIALFIVQGGLSL